MSGNCACQRYAILAWSIFLQEEQGVVWPVWPAGIARASLPETYATSTPVVTASLSGTEMLERLLRRKADS